MARARRRSPSLRAVEAPNSLIASAVRITPTPGGRTAGRPRGQSQEWQSQTWYFLDTIGELAFAAGWFSNAMSRVRLYIQHVAPDGSETELEAGPAVDALNALTGGPAGQSVLMASLGIHLFGPGEAYLIGETVQDEDVWGVFSTEEVKQTAGTRWEVDRGDGEKRTLDTSEEAEEPAIVIRIWRSHPRMWVEATSPVRAVLPVLRELEQLTKHVGASIDSRLAGAGLLLIPSEMSFGSPAQGPVDENGQAPTAPPEDPSQDPFLISLTEAMVTPIKDRDNASAVVPVVVRAPGALIGNAKHITFSTPLDEKAMDLRAECIRRLALGIDMPPEVLLGTGDVNHWGAWQIDEAALKIHIEPACELVCNALTTRYLYPVLEGQGALTSGIVIAADTSELRLRPNRSQEAFDLYDRLVIDADALRRETGFEDGDEPDALERQTQLLLKVAGGVTTADLTAAALSALGVDLQPKASEVAPEETPPPEGTPAIEPAAPIEDNRAIPEQQAAALLACSEVVVHRAVERANNRVNNRAKVRRPIPDDRMEEALRGAWEPGLLGSVAAGLGVDPDVWVAAMQRYTSVLLATGEDHNPAVLDRVLREMVLGQRPLRAVTAGG